MLHEQLHAIKKELGLVKEDKDALLEKYRTILKGVVLPEAAKVGLVWNLHASLTDEQKVIDEEMMRLDHLESSSPDYK